MQLLTTRFTYRTGAFCPQASSTAVGGGSARGGPDRLRHRLLRVLRLVQGHLKMRATNSSSSAVVMQLDAIAADLPTLLLQSDVGGDWELL